MEELVVRIADQSLTAAILVAVLYWFMRRAEERLDHVCAQLRVLSVLHAEAHGISHRRIQEIQRAVNGD